MRRTLVFPHGAGARRDSCTSVLVLCFTHVVADGAWHSGTDPLGFYLFLALTSQDACKD